MANNVSIIYSDNETQYFRNEIKTAIRNFMKYTESEDVLGIILRAQIYIENDLDILLRKLLIHPEKISLQFFSAKLDAAYALGGIDDDWYHALKKLNKIRNKCAHDFNYNFTEDDYNDLISTLSKDAKNEFQHNLKQEEWVNEIIAACNNKPTPTLSQKYQLRVLLSDFMLYMMQQHQSISYVWKEISFTKEAQILEERQLLLEELSSRKENQ